MKYITFLFVIGFSAQIHAQEAEQADEPPCAHATLMGKWVGPESEMNLDENCKGTMGEKEFTYNDSEKLNRGEDKCKVFQKANEMVLDCGKEEVERYHRFNGVVHK